MRNKARSILTLLGMIIGVGAVIAIVSLGEGLRADFARQMSTLGSDVFYMMPKAPKRPGQAPTRPDLFEMDDIEAIEEQCPLVKKVVPGMMAGVTVKYRDKMTESAASGVDEHFLEISSTAKLKEGRFFTAADVKAAARVAIIGDEIADDLFEEWEEPIGSLVKLNGVNYQIIGRYEHYSGMISEGGNINTSFAVPITTLQKRIIGSEEVYWVTIYMPKGTDLQEAKDQVSVVMRQRRRVRNVSDDDFQFISPDDFMQMGNQFINVLISIFGAIAFISLLVGGVGIMNIMLVSVTERTREIGLRMALGAGRRTVLTQFLVEAILLTLGGGLLGLAVGYGGAIGLSPLISNFFGGSWIATIPLPWVIAAISVSVLVGLIFGVYPAFKASQLDPVEAMRFE